MRIKRLKVTNFRNISENVINFCETANIIYGDNGQGKTNLVEAVYVLSGVKSFRGARDQQLIQFNQSFARLELDFMAQERDQTAVLVLGVKKQAQLNEVTLQSAGELSGRFCCVVFSPEDLALVKQGPKEKRQFIDQAICQIKPKYHRIMNEYSRVLSQRNALLKDLYAHTELMDTLDIWDQRLGMLYGIILKTRLTFTRKLGELAQECYSGIAKQQERFGMSYIGSIEGLEDAANMERGNLQQAICQAILGAREQDIRAGTTVLGAHRDDIEITLDGVSARLYGSQGQQRSCVLALKLAECELIQQNLGEYPVILLDDVMSELDEHRRDYLLNRLEGKQVVITCCDKALFSGLQGGKTFRMAQGRVYMDAD